MSITAEVVQLGRPAVLRLVVRLLEPVLLGPPVLRELPLRPLVIRTLLRLQELGLPPRHLRCQSLGPRLDPDLPQHLLLVSHPLLDPLVVALLRLEILQLDFLQLLVISLLLTLLLILRLATLPHESQLLVIRPLEIQRLLNQSLFRCLAILLLGSQLLETLLPVNLVP